MVVADGGTDATTDAEPGDGGADADIMQDALQPDGSKEDGASTDGGPITCAPNNDGTIHREEVPLRAGVHATFKVALGATVNTAGTLEGGRRVWDLTAPLADGHLLTGETRPVTGTWYAEDFPNATYAARLSDTNELLGVFRVTETALELLGVVSEQDGLTSTKLTYDPPVKVLSFPLTVGKTYSTESTVTGRAQGVIAYYWETYENQVDAEGDLKTPFSTFHVLRVRTKLTRQVGMLTTVVRSFAFVTECFGTVATVRSEDGEDSVEFTKASEVWGLSP